MSMPAPLCVLPPDDSGACCGPPVVIPTAPLGISNPPGLSAIQYRIGTFTSFRRAMLDEVARPDLLAFLDNSTNPFAAWHEGIDGDYQTMFVELWAYLSDILTFYQERIANEAYLPTATQRDSLLRLAQLINYRPNPGSGASALLAFTVEKKKLVAIPAGFRVGSKPAPGKPAVVFEASQAISAPGDSSAIPLSPIAPVNQFAALSDPLAFFEGRIPRPILLEFASNPRSIVLQGVNTRLAVGDYVLVVENARQSSEKQTLLQLDAVTLDKGANTTTITWTEAAGASYQNVTLYALRVKAAPFGSNAPNWSSLPPALNDLGGSSIMPDPYPNAPYKNENWDDPNDSHHWFYLPTPDNTPATILYLDSTYANIHATQQTWDWAVLLTDGLQQTFQVTDASPASKAAYAISAKVTRLTLTSGLPSSSPQFPLRNTIVLTGSEPLPIQNTLPLPDPLTGQTLILAGLFPQLQTGQTVIVRGNIYDTTTVPPSQMIGAESGILAGPPVLDMPNSLTTVTLKQTLTNPYVRATSVLMANIAEGTQGETVRDEVLGSGDGSALQSYALKQKPLTYLPATDAEGLASVKSTLLVTVNGVLWNEQPTLLESPANARAFTTTEDDSDQTTISFGDGINGARPPTGKDNIHARYRKGLGASGNLGMDALSQLLDSLPSLQKVTNPQPTFGGADRENISQIRRNAPASLSTLGRAVSDADYAALARSYPGVAKASAVWVLRDPATLRAIPQPYVQLTVAATNGVKLSEQPTFAHELRAFLDRRRDANVPLRIIDFTPVYLDLTATIQIWDNYPSQATLAAAWAALQPGVNPDGTAGYFAFARLDFGQSIYLSAVYAALQAVPGVKDANITRLRRVPSVSQYRWPGVYYIPLFFLETPGDILIRPTELAVIKNDPQDSTDQFGKLEITGTGGFADT